MHGPRRAAPTLPTLVARAALVPAVAVSLLAGICGGLVRAGVALPAAPGAWIGHAAAGHAFLMICTFMGTVIGIERAVAARKPLAYAAPFASAAAGLLYLGGEREVAAVLAVAAAVAFVVVNLHLVVRQRAPHTVVLLSGAAAWLEGNALFLAGAAPTAVVQWWFAFLVLTIAAERLEMTRLLPRRPGASKALGAVLAAVLAACALGAAAPRWSGVLYGAALAALAAWLLRYDIARRTLLARGLSRYMAVCLLLGYFWLAVAGVAWCATSLGLPARDAALHALALGFVFSMMLGHAPVILPALARIKLLYGRAFYLPLALLHASLALRLGGMLAAGAAGNALAIALFVGTVAGAALAWRFRRPSTTPHDDAAAAP